MVFGAYGILGSDINRLPTWWEMWFLVLVDAGSRISQFQCMLGGVVPFQGILGDEVS